MNAKLKLSTALAAMFLLGCAAGAGLSSFLHPHFSQPPNARDIDRHMLDFWTRQLELSDAQREQVRPLAADFAQKAEALHDQSHDLFMKLADATDDQLAQYLTPSQKTALDRLRAERKQGFKGHWPPQDPPQGPPPGP